jgi:MYXO-CTERM domain-containing protein
VPVGAPDTGATDTGAPDGRLLAVGALGLAGAAGLALHRRRETPGR